MSQELIQIQGCQCSQLTNGQDSLLSEGPLSLIKGSDSKLSLICGTSAFALRDNTPFYTHADSDRIYLFKPSLAPVDGVTTFIKVLLPESITTEPQGEVAKQRDQLEQILISNGMLKEGFSAIADEVGRGLSSDATNLTSTLTSKINAAKDSHIQNRPAGDVGQFSETTHSFADDAARLSGQAAEYAQKASHAVENAAKALGAKISEAVAQLSDNKEGGGQTLGGDSEKSEPRKVAEGIWAGIGSAATGIAASTEKLYNATAQAAQEVIKHDFGSDAAKVSAKAGETARNIGTVGADAFTATSAVFHGANAAEGYKQGSAPQTLGGSSSSSSAPAAGPSNSQP